MNIQNKAAWVAGANRQHETKSAFTILNVSTVNAQ